MLVIITIFSRLSVTEVAIASLKFNLVVEVVFASTYLHIFIYTANKKS